MIIKKVLYTLYIHKSFLRLLEHGITSQI